MKLSYRNQRNAEAVARYWNKPLEKPDWYRIEALSDDDAEIMIYDVIGWPFVEASEFVRAISEMKQSIITVRINSPGGDVFDGIAIFNALKAHKSKIVTRVESLAASISSVIALAGSEVQAYQNTMMMIHEPWTYAFGNQYDLRETAEILEKISSNMVDIYSGSSSLGKREIKQIMKDETWLTAKEAKDKGFVDTILDGKAIKAEFDLSIFANAPHEPTEREREKALRDVGFTLKEAKAILAGRRESSGIEAMKAELERIISIFGGK
jgi:ATP-dependent Clp endopeptidase proteolytic subunit ClpP